MADELLKSGIILIDLSHTTTIAAVPEKKRIFWLVLRLSICLQPANGEGAVTIAALLR